MDKTVIKVYCKKHNGSMYENKKSTGTTIVIDNKFLESKTYECLECLKESQDLKDKNVELNKELSKCNTQIKALEVINNWFKKLIKIIDKNWTDKAKIEYIKSVIHNSPQGTKYFK